MLNEGCREFVEGSCLMLVVSDFFKFMQIVYMVYTKYIVSETLESTFISAFKLSDGGSNGFGEVVLNKIKKQILPFQWNDELIEYKNTDSIIKLTINGNPAGFLIVKSVGLETYDLIIDNRIIVFKGSDYFSNITILEDDVEIGKISRRVNAYQSTMGVALNNNLHHGLILFSLVLCLSFHRKDI